jgi:DNA polymerase
LEVDGRRMVIRLGADAEKVLSLRYPAGHRLSRPFVKPQTIRQGTTYLLFPEHPGSLRFKRTADRLYYSPSLGRATTWGINPR